MSSDTVTTKRGQRPEMRDVTIKVTATVMRKLTEAAKQRGYTVSTYAGLLFNGAYSARVGQERGQPASDEELDEQVTLVFACAGQGDSAAIATATGLPAERVERILAAWRHHASTLQP